jgi:hypothetical protein
VLGEHRAADLGTFSLVILAHDYAPQLLEPGWCFRSKDWRGVALVGFAPSVVTGLHW